MSKEEIAIYRCEKCNRKVLSGSHLNIVTSLAEVGHWSRLHIEITHKHGVHNDGKTEPADICKTCAVTLLRDAIKRIGRGERATAGTESIEQGNWE